MAALDNLIQLYSEEKTTVQPTVSPASIQGREAWAAAYRIFAHFIPKIIAAAHELESATVAGNIFQAAQRELAGLYAGGITGRRLAMCVFDILADTYEAEKTLDQAEKQL